MIIHPSMYFCNENLFSLPFSRKHQISKFKLKYTFDRDFEFLQVMQNALLDQTQLQSKKKSRSFCPSYSPLSVKSAESLIAESCNRHLTSITFCCSRYFLFPLDCLSKSINNNSFSLDRNLPSAHNYEKDKLDFKNIFLFTSSLFFI